MDFPRPSASDLKSVVRIRPPSFYFLNYNGVYCPRPQAKLTSCPNNGQTLKSKLHKHAMRRNQRPWMKGSEGEMNMKAFLNCRARQSRGIVWGKVMSSDWLIRLNLLLICQLRINKLLCISRAISLPQSPRPSLRRPTVETGRSRHSAHLTI